METPPQPIILTPKQKQLWELLSSTSTYVLAVGGQRSGKTFALCLAVAYRAMNIPNSRHAIFRQTAISARDSIFELTLRDVFRLKYPEVYELCQDGKQGCSWNKSEMKITLPNGSVITVGGLDDDARVERLMGMEYTTIYLNEASQLDNYKIVTRCVGRLSEVRQTRLGNPATVKLLIDCNPPEETHWTCKVFRDHTDPVSNLPLRNPDNFVSIQMNTLDNKANLSESYIREQEEALTGDERDRLWHGVWQIANPNALFTLDDINKHRDLNPPTIFKRTVIAVDPAATSTGDEHGIIVIGLGENDEAYVLEDLSHKGSPEKWSKTVANAFTKYRADCVVAERNQGGDMVRAVLQTAYRNLPVKLVWASKGKYVRAEPASKLYQNGKVHHTQEFTLLETQMRQFKVDMKRGPGNSPDRVDALVWGLEELMLGEQKPRGVTSKRSKMNRYAL